MAATPCALVRVPGATRGSVTPSTPDHNSMPYNQCFRLNSYNGASLPHGQPSIPKGSLKKQPGLSAISLQHRYQSTTAAGCAHDSSRTRAPNKQTSQAASLRQPNPSHTSCHHLACGPKCKAQVACNKTIAKIVHLSKPEPKPKTLSAASHTAHSYNLCHPQLQLAVCCCC